MMHAEFLTMTPAVKRMTSDARIRTAHRWLALIFTTTVIANFVVRAFGAPPSWITYSPLPPLFALMLSGLYLFFEPYYLRRRANPRPPAN